MADNIRRKCLKCGLKPKEDSDIKAYRFPNPGATNILRTPDIEQFYITVTGTIMNKNTVEDFKTIDKAAFLNSVGEVLRANIKKKTWITNPVLNFIVLAFAL